MGGIACIYNIDGQPSDPILIRRMSAATPYRGPDGVAHWNEGPIALACLKFWTTPEAVHETQPLFDETSTLCLVMDGRVDNHVDLRAILETRGAVLRSDTDAELVLRAYQCWGDDCPGYIVGDFVFCLWNKRAKQLFCARDILGIKPFYYFFDTQKFLCASELHQLFEYPNLSREPNEEMIGEFLAASPTNREETLYRAIKRLPPAYCLCIQPGRIRRWRYWTPNPAKAVRYKRDDEYANHFLELFSETVRCRLRSHGRVGADLSGGLDSSSVVSVAQDLHRHSRGIETFSLVFPGRECDERKHIDAVVQKWNAQANFYEPNDRQVDWCFDQVRRYRDLPDYPNSVMFYPLKALARDRGVRVILGGDGGDQWLDGSHDSCADLLRQMKLSGLWRQFRSICQANGRGEYVWRLLRHGLGRLVFAWAPAVPSRIFIPEYINDQFAQKIALADRLTTAIANISLGSSAQSELNATLTSGWSAHGNETGDRALSWFQIEQRHPLNDRRIIEFAMALPADQLHRGSQRRFILRQSMRGLLPETVRTRIDKADFSHVFAETLRSLGGEGLFDSLAIASAGWVKLDEVRSKYQSLTRLYKAGDPGYISLIWHLWMVVAVELWFQTVFVNSGKAALSHLAPGPASHIAQSE
jgi:asparagine synthase (glutamine-hydrolysing)